MGVNPAARPLQRILGLGFGLAVLFGNTVGVGILRLPGTVAAALGDRTLILVAWILGGAYVLMCAIAGAELAAALPEAGGFRVYARRALGEPVGYGIAWCDWLCSVVAVALVSVTAVTFLGALIPPVADYPRTIAVAIIALLTVGHWIGLRVGASLTTFISAALGVMLLLLVISCLLAAPEHRPADLPLPQAANAAPLFSVAMLMTAVPAMRSILTAYDGWYGPIYMAEENRQPARTLPRAMIGGAALVVGLYLSINLAILHVLPLQVLAESTLPAADAARLVLPRGGEQLVTIISLMTVLSLINTTLLVAPRIVFAISRDGLFWRKASEVSESGTPRMALLLTATVAALLVVTGSFEQFVALYSVLFLFLYISAFLAVFVLRYREPSLPRPFKAPGFPFTTGIVLLGSLAFLAAAVAEDPRSGNIGVLFLAGCVGAYARVNRARKLRAATA